MHTARGNAVMMVVGGKGASKSGLTIFARPNVNLYLHKRFVNVRLHMEDALVPRNLPRVPPGHPQFILGG